MTRVDYNNEGLYSSMGYTTTRCLTETLANRWCVRHLSASERVRLLLSSQIAISKEFQISFIHLGLEEKRCPLEMSQYPRQLFPC